MCVNIFLKLPNKSNFNQTTKKGIKVKKPKPESTLIKIQFGKTFGGG